MIKKTTGRKLRESKSTLWKFSYFDSGEGGEVGTYVSLSKAAVGFGRSCHLQKTGEVSVIRPQQSEVFLT